MKQEKPEGEGCIKWILVIMVIVVFSVIAYFINNFLL